MNIKELIFYIESNSALSHKLITNVIKTLGFPLTGNKAVFNELSSKLENCAEHGANIGISGFIYYSETIPFFRKNRQDIINHMEQIAAEFGTDIISMVQGFGVFRNCEKPSSSEVGRALWDSKENPELTTLYNVFAWYALEETAQTWYRYLEEHPTIKAELAA